MDLKHTSAELESQLLQGITRHLGLLLIVFTAKLEVRYSNATLVDVDFSQVATIDDYLLEQRFSPKHKELARALRLLIAAVCANRQKSNWVKSFDLVDDSQQTWKIVISPTFSLQTQETGLESTFLLSANSLSERHLSLNNYLLKHYDLTSREVDIVQRLVQQKNLRTIALELFLSYQTVRWHLKEIFKKVGVNRQSELISKITADPRATFSQ
jgi:DNA-binding CsgD family transcriptional regulator